MRCKFIGVLNRFNLRLPVLDANSPKIPTAISVRRVKSRSETRRARRRFKAGGSGCSAVFPCLRTKDNTGINLFGQGKPGHVACTFPVCSGCPFVCQLTPRSNISPENTACRRARPWFLRGVARSAILTPDDEYARGKLIRLPRNDSARSNSIS